MIKLQEGRTGWSSAMAFSRHADPNALMITNHETPEFQRLMASIGTLLFQWSRLEEALTDDIRRLRIEIEGPASLIRVRGSFGDRLREWRGLLSQKTRRKPALAGAVDELANQMEQLKSKRNMIVHDFAGATAPEEGEPFVSCAPRDRGIVSVEERRITLTELTEAIDAIERCRRRIASVAAEQDALA